MITRSLYFSLVIVLMMSCLSVSDVVAQTDIETFRQKQQEDFKRFRNKNQNDYKAFRKRINDEYAAFVERIWKEYKVFKGVPLPDEPAPVPPIVMPEEDKNKPIEDQPVIIEEVVQPIVPEPQPDPIVPVEPQPQPVNKHTIVFYGTSVGVSLDATNSFALKNLDEVSIADAWRIMGDGRFDAMVSDCLEMRRKLHLSDWAYLQMLNELATSFWGGQKNEATLMTAYVYSQSGYKMRLAKTDTRIVMLYASKHQIFGKSYFVLDDKDTYYYIMGDQNVDGLLICQASFPSEKSMSLCFRENPLFTTCTTTVKNRKSINTELECATVSDEHLLNYYSTYPSSMLNDNPMTRWAIYANTPLSNVAKETLYPQLKQAMAALTQTEKVMVLLDWVQNAFVYEYDDKVWGDDRAFFADESLYYPYCDCEDRSILFTRMVRDLIGLPCLLVYYPGHLAAAVCFDEKVNGDYIMVGNNRFIVCDPTYINAPIGATMPGMDNSSAKVIVLE
ncbi:MAG: hypothetical protein II287_02445 [Bacteroidaceae bacterium]|nr:hypothetical protein [Bacteroidaceae bacterium]